MNKKNEVKDNLEAGMYFKFKEHSRYSVHRNKVYSLSITDDGMALRSYYTSADASLFFQTSVIIRRIGETSMDYYDFDMFNKKTRGRLYYKEIDSFFYVKTDKNGNEYTTTEKPKDPNDEESELDDILSRLDYFAGRG